MLAAVLALLIGLSLGLLGGGGSILTVPVFAYVLGFDPKQAIAMSLPVVGTGALAGMLQHWRAGRVRFGTAFTFGAVAMAVSFVAARLSARIPGPVQMLVLSVVILAAAGAMLRPPHVQADAESPVHPALLAATAAAVGALTGVVGIGGGFLIVPALVVLARVPMHEAVGTSLLVIALNAFAGWAGHLGREPLPWGFLAGFTALLVVGTLAGSALVPRVPQAQLKRAFAIFLLGVGAFVLWQNRALLLT